VLSPFKTKKSQKKKQNGKRIKPSPKKGESDGYFVCILKTPLLSLPENDRIDTVGMRIYVYLYRFGGEPTKKTEIRNNPNITVYTPKKRLLWCHYVRKEEITS
jgi:hypothetical protein